MTEPDEAVKAKDQPDDGGVGPTDYVAWDHLHHFETRGLTRSNLISFGADPKDENVQEIEWNPGNNWRVPRSKIPLTDIQLGQLLGVDKSFRLVTLD